MPVEDLHLCRSDYDDVLDVPHPWSSQSALTAYYEQCQALNAKVYAQRHICKLCSNESTYTHVVQAIHQSLQSAFTKEQSCLSYEVLRNINTFSILQVRLRQAI